MVQNLWLKQVNRIDSWQYDVPLTQSINTLHHKISSRSGILLRWQTSTAIYYSDICPLPGFNKESLEACFTEFKNYINDGARSGLSPAVDLAINSARIQIELKADAQQFDPPKFSLCQLLSIDEDIENTLSDCIKIKVGNTTLDSDIPRIQQAIKNLRINGKIRLDASGQWNSTSLNYLFNHVDPDYLQYIEDPFENIEDYKHWPYPVPFALDKLSHLWHPDLNDFDGLSTLVIKPLFLGLDKAIQLTRQATQKNIKVVFSSAYESSINLNFYAWLADHLNLADAQGLDTAKYWSSHLLSPPGFFRITDKQDNKPVLLLNDLNSLGRLL